MKLTDKEIKEITKGALLIEQEGGMLAFYRMPKETANRFEEMRTELKIRALASSGVRFDFTTDADYLKITYLLKTGSSQVKGNFDVWVNGRFYSSAGEDIIDGKVRDIEFTFEKGEKRITVYFPTLAQTFITSVEVSGEVTPCENKPLALFFGDSITQGYITEFPSLNYVTRFAERSGYDFYNFAVGGDIYKGFIAEIEVERRPEIVFTAYGTNDWNQGISAAALKKNMRDYYSVICEKYPSSRIVAILPIWRADGEPARTIGTFDELFPVMRNILAEFPKVEIIDGRELVPHVTGLYADVRLHPNDLGFEFYANALFDKMSK